MFFIDLHPYGTPRSRSWGSGWPNGQTSRMVDVTWSNGASPVGGIRSEVATLVRLLGNECIRRGYHPHPGWCWGYDNRAISGTIVPSNHSWGLAVDINAPTNPRQWTLRTDMPSWMPKLWEFYGFRWGGHYPYGIDKDPMHYEFMGSPLQAALATAVARVSLGPRPPTPVPPSDGDIMRITHKANDGALSYWILSGGKLVNINQDSAETYRSGPTMTVAGDTAWQNFLDGLK